MLNNKLFWIIMLVFYSINTYALKGDSEKLIHIDADKLTIDKKNMVSIFTGNIVITQGTLTVKADYAIASQDSAGYKTLILTGRPVTFSQLSDDKDMIEGQGNEFDYDTKSNTAILKGRARVKKGDNIIMGNKITYNTQLETYSASSINADGVSNTKSGRVTVILQPNQKAK